MSYRRNSDVGLRRSGRRLHSGGGLHDQELVIAQGLRAGRLSPERVVIAAAMGSEGARMAVGGLRLLERMTSGFFLRFLAPNLEEWDAWEYKRYAAWAKAGHPGPEPSLTRKICQQIYAQETIAAGSLYVDGGAHAEHILTLIAPRSKQRRPLFARLGLAVSKPVIEKYWKGNDETADMLAALGTIARGGKVRAEELYRIDADMDTVASSMYDTRGRGRKRAFVAGDVAYQVASMLRSVTARKVSDADWLFGSDLEWWLDHPESRAAFKGIEKSERPAAVVPRVLASWLLDPEIQ